MRRIASKKGDPILSVVKQYFTQLLASDNSAVRELPFSGRSDFAAAFTIHCPDLREDWLVEICDDHLVSAVLTDAPRADLGFILDAETFRAIVTGQLAVQKAFLTGKVKVKGSMFKAMSFSRLLGAFFKKLAEDSGNVSPADETPAVNDFAEEIMEIQLSDGTTLRAVLGYDDAVRPQAALFIFPPHPLLGGDCDNNVVNLLYAAAVANGQLAVKFNYRLVEADNITSQAMLDYWRQCDRQDDYSEVIADSLELVRGVVNEIEPALEINFAAYSFGCYTALQAMTQIEVRNFIGVSPPLKEYDFESLFARYSHLNFIIADHDEFCPAECFTPLAEIYNINLEIITPSDHFFRDSEMALKQACLTIMENNYAQENRRKS